ncbi:MAG: DUF3641 domain-containing protein [Methylococcales bacterium]|nr:DUF3641 domain-containing protein [Methylococcales bacterium]
MLQLSLGANPSGKTYLGELSNSSITASAINVRQHCYGCTAGQGSSSGGALD